MELSEEQINEIAEELECGSRAFLNIETGEIKTILDWDEMANDESWELEWKEIEKNPGKYISFRKMDFDESFQLMRDFVETVNNKELKKKLEFGLHHSKRFKYLKDIIDDDYECRQKWFKFKHDGYVNFVKEQFADYYNKMEE